jgi:hypothetical protein
MRWRLAGTFLTGYTFWASGDQAQHYVNRKAAFFGILA